MDSKSAYNTSGTSIFGDSDVENLSFTSATTEMRDEVSYWFGQKYFECVISQQVLQDCGPYDAPSGVDSQLFRSMRDFPYEMCLTTLSEGHRRELSGDPQTSLGDSRTRLLILVGWIVHEGSSRAKQQMLQTVRTFHQDRNGRKRENSRPASGSRREELRGPTWTAVNPGLYSVAVNNYGMKIGVKPMYSVEPVSSDPCLWKTLLAFKGQTFEGTAAGAKQAQHEAARQACKYFDLHVT